MSGIDYLADTNAVIYLLAGNACMEPYLDKRLGISVISVMEALSFPNITSEEESNIRSFLNDCTILSIDEKTTEQAIAYRKAHKVKLPDAIIAATATVNNVPLISADAELSKIDGLRVEHINPA